MPDRGLFAMGLDKNAENRMAATRAGMTTRVQWLFFVNPRVRRATNPDPLWCLAKQSITAANKNLKMLMSVACESGNCPQNSTTAPFPGIHNTGL